MKSLKNNKGFSLVELLVVIAIMVVLVGVVAPSLLGNIEKSREASDVQILDNIASVVQTGLANEKFYSNVQSGRFVTPVTLASILDGSAVGAGTGGTAADYAEMKAFLTEAGVDHKKKADGTVDTIYEVTYLKSKDARLGNIYIAVTTDGRVTVDVRSKTDATKAIKGAKSQNDLSVTR